MVGTTYPHPKLVASLPAPFDAAFGRRRWIGKAWLWRNLRTGSHLWLRRIRRFWIRTLPCIIVVRRRWIVARCLKILWRTLHLWWCCVRRIGNRIGLRIRRWTRIIVGFRIRRWTRIQNWFWLRRGPCIVSGFGLRCRTRIRGFHWPRFRWARDCWLGRNWTWRSIHCCIQIGIILGMRFKIHLLRRRFCGLCHQRIVVGYLKLPEFFDAIRSCGIVFQPILAKNRLIFSHPVFDFSVKSTWRIAVPFVVTKKMMRQMWVMVVVPRMLKIPPCIIR